MVRELIAQFEALDDPRCHRQVKHKLVDVLVIAVRAVIAEAESFEGIAAYGFLVAERCRCPPERRFDRDQLPAPALSAVFRPRGAGAA